MVSIVFIFLISVMRKGGPSSGRVRTLRRPGTLGCKASDAV